MNVHSQKPTIVIHRVNDVSLLKNIPHNYGVEIDLRAEDRKIVLNHDPFKGGTDFLQWLDYYKHALIVANIKESGIENTVIKLLDQRSITNFFLLDCEFPYIYTSIQHGERRIAVRFSEAEPIENAQYFSNKADWLWIDTQTKLPITEENITTLENFKTCLVCPERWNREEDIKNYFIEMKNLGFVPNAIMTSQKHSNLWQSLFV